MKLSVLLFALIVAAPLLGDEGTTTTRHAAEDAHQMHSMAGMSMEDPAGDLLMRQASGTSMNPAAAPMEMSMFTRGSWMLMVHGAAFVDQIEQSGPRGDDKLISTNWLMGTAQRPLGRGVLMFRSMLSLEPLTVGKKYPELFQTGETIDGHPIVDAQHPHDFFMEVAAEYARALTPATVGYLYVAPFGDPSLGPVAFPHRASASEIPQATLGHHVQDSTHIAGSVITLGAQHGAIGYSLSGFHGREPDENRWDIDTGSIDSWAARVTFDPTTHWTAQVSAGHLVRPEAAERSDVTRTTASISYSGDTRFGRADTSLIFGHNQKSEGRSVSSWLIESVQRLGEKNYLTGRFEIVDKDELFDHQSSNPEVFRIKAMTLGYSRDVFRVARLDGAVGVNVTFYSIPDALQGDYGSSPNALHLFVRLRIGGGEQGSGHTMH